jgi:pimeloyl-ACP methyl ester carboxylesterase
VELLRLVDGRALELYVSGPEDATPLIVHHGIPGSAAPLPPLETAAHGAGLRYVSYARPGYAGSSRLVGRCVADTASDVAEILLYLGADRCVVTGWSGGGPHALATAVVLPDQVAGCLLIGSLAPYTAEDLDWFDGLAEQNEQSTRLILDGDHDGLRALLVPYAAAENFADIDSFIAIWPSMLPGRDRRALQSAFGFALAQHMGGGVRESTDGWMDDLLAQFVDWGFDPESVSCPVLLWHGANDLVVPRTHWIWFDEHLSTVQSALELEDGHFSLMADHARSMVTELARLLDL